MIITISGTAGSGKSTIARRLAETLGFKHYSMGDLQRQIAEEKGLTITELGEKEKRDPSIDNMVDNRMKKLGQDEDNFIIDAWLAAKFIPHAVKLFFDADIDVRAKRITEKRVAESIGSVKVARETILKREKTNRERWLEFYDFDFMDKSNYDLIIDTSDTDADRVFSQVKDYIKNKK